MFLKGLKSKLTVNLALFLLLAIILTDFVVIQIVEKNLIRNRLQLGKQLIAEAGKTYYDLQIQNPTGESDGFFSKTNIHHPWMVYGLFSLRNGKNIPIGQMPIDLSINIRPGHEAALISGALQSLFLGETWGVFWKQNKYLIISAPFSVNTSKGAGTIVVKLEDIYTTLRESQKIIVFYCFANLIVLLFFGLLRLKRIVVRPIHRFIRLTEDLRSTDQFPTYPGRHDTEFGQLSNAIHGMARRIEADKERIEKSLYSLEKAHADLKNAQNEMIRTEKLASIGRLSAGIAHEIGNPIGIVLGYLGLIKRQPAFQENLKGQEYIERAESEINRINTIIRQLLDFSRTSSSEKQIVFLHALVKDVRQMFLHQPIMGKIELTQGLSATDDKVFGDYQQLRQVLINLLINAVDSIAASDNRDHGKILLTTRDISEKDENAVNQSQTIELTVRDNGTGIAREEINNIFDPFYTTKEPGKGTGLGLSVSYMIVEQFGGTITVKSELNKGTAMSIYLQVSHEF